MRNYFKYISAGLFLILITYGAYWIVQLIWFRPQDPRLFYQRFLIDYGLSHPEWLTDVAPPLIEHLDAYNTQFNSSSRDSKKQDSALFQQSLEVLRGYKPQKERETEELNTHLEHWLKTELLKLEQDFPYYSVHNQTDAFESALYTLVFLHDIQNKTQGSEYVNRLRLLDNRIKQITTNFIEESGKSRLPERRILQERLVSLKKFVETETQQNILYRSFAAKAIRADPVQFNNNDARDQLEAIEKILIQEIYPAITDLIREIEVVINQNEFNFHPMDKETYKRYLNIFALDELEPDSVFSEILLLIDSLKTKRSQVLKSIEFSGEEHHYPSGDSGSYEVLKEIRASVETIKEQVKGLFPQIEENDLEIRLAPEGLSFKNQNLIYIPPSINAERAASIYISKNFLEQSEKAPLFIKIYESSIPGKHLYYSARRVQAELPSLHKGLWLAIYDESWPIYGLSLIDRKLALFENQPQLKLALINSQISSAILCCLDIGVNFKSWSDEESKDWLENHVPKQVEKHRDWISRVKLMPVNNSLPFLGYLRLMKKEKDAERKANGTFIIQDYLFELLTGPLKS